MAADVLAGRSGGYSQLRWLKDRLALFVERDAYVLNMLDHVGVADVFEDGQVNDVWQEQIVKFAHDLEEYIQRQIAAAD